MKKVCIVVPVYKQELNPFEKISLRQLLRMLGDYPICLIQPDSMEFQYNELSGYEYNVYKFSGWYFRSTATYSELLLSPFFYERFSDYEYMLIYQLDCFVFSDRLSDFCDMNYDYIGAPQYHSWTNDVVVGNGGLSLRKVNAALNVTRRFKEIVEDSQQREVFLNWEDNFFSYCGRKMGAEFAVPDIPLANTFSVVLDIERGIQNIPINGLPFGTHAWHRLNFDFWKKVISFYGYQTDNLIAEKNINTLEIDRSDRYNNYLLDRFKEFPKEVKQGIIEELGLVSDGKYIMWGAGRFGRNCLRILLALGVKVFEIIDSNPKDDMLCGISVNYPDFEMIREKKLTILIGSEKYEKEIECELIMNNCKKLIKLTRVFGSKWEVVQSRCRVSFPEIEGVTVPFHFLVDNSWMQVQCRRDLSRGMQEV